MICADPTCGREFEYAHKQTGKQKFCSTNCAKRVSARKRYWEDPDLRERKLARGRDYYHDLDSLGYAQRRLQMRRVRALHRRSARTQAVLEGKRTEDSPNG